ncbi:hypothetical protein MMC13_005211 [Lambiella insularis]|nr:hypothetical protein [Lambiella insularis]
MSIPSNRTFPHSAATDTGISRLALSAADKQARDWFVATTRELGCEVSVDAMGNTFAVRPGRKRGPPTCAGSHLDTQPMGGRYDGILGVCAGVEMLRVLKDEEVETEFPVGVVNWTNEEGARFPISMVSSGVWAGSIPLETAHNLKEVGSGGRTMKQELEAIGYLGHMDASHKAMPLGAHFELHIAYRWHTLTVRGRAAHTGTTPFAARADPLLATAKLLLAAHRIAAAHGGLASTGILSLAPGAVNTVPSRAVFSLDIRAAADETLLKMEEEMRAEFEQLASGERVAEGEVRGKGCGVEWRLDAPSGAVRFDEGCVRCVEEAAGEEGLASCAMTSGAGEWVLGCVVWKGG